MIISFTCLSYKMTKAWYTKCTVCMYIGMYCIACSTRRVLSLSHSWADGYCACRFSFLCRWRFVQCLIIDHKQCLTNCYTSNLSWSSSILTSKCKIYVNETSWINIRDIITIKKTPLSSGAWTKSKYREQFICFMSFMRIQDSINRRAGAQLEKHRLRKIFRHEGVNVTFENIFVSFINWYCK